VSLRVSPTAVQFSADVQLTWLNSAFELFGEGSVLVTHVPSVPVTISG
jgi:hypothetical protein